MNPPLPMQVAYRATDMVIAVRCTDETQVTAVQKFAADNHFPCPPRPDDRPVYHCNAVTSPQGEVLWA